MSLQPEFELSISWEETFELPRRYRRNIKGQVMGKDFTLEYAITGGSGWTRENGGEPKDYKGEKLKLDRCWNVFLAILPSYLSDGVKLSSGGTDKIDGKEAVGVVVSGEVIEGEATLFFDKKSGLLLKMKKRMLHPFSGQEVAAESLLGEYKKIYGVEYPHRITTYIDGKKVIEMEITRIQFLKKVENRLFEKP